MEISQKESLTSAWFKELRDKICAEFEKIEEEYLASCKDAVVFDKAQKFARKQWQREGGGGGEMSVMKGNVFEKVGVNISTVFGDFSDEFRAQIPGTKNSAKFFATGVSLVAHMASPLVPAVHMNTRFIHTQKEWFGGGADLNPMFENLQDTQDFHQAFKKVCDDYDLENGQPTDFSYQKFKKECDDYFFIKHRGVPRGVGGIFYDYLNSASKDFSVKSADFAESSDLSFARDFAFSKNVGLAFLEIFPKLVRRHMFEKWSNEQREHQLRKRGFYAEFNLVYDRGTKFGLMTGGNSEAILMSLPPVAKWD